MQLVEVNGVKCRFFKSPEEVMRKNHPNIYYIRHSEFDFDKPETVERFVFVNRFGVILADKPLLKDDDEYCEIKSFKPI